ncbi:MAG: RAMP superfamily CRISPR-associated protein [Promethearchaeota archaeon]
MSYDYILAEDLIKNEINEKKLHNTLNQILIFTVEITTLSPIYIGEGPFETTQIDGKCVLKTIHSQNIPYIPGSSIKGCIRTHFEYYEPHSCLLNTFRRENCFIRPNDTKIELCKTCKLFGASGFSSRIFFTDAYPIDKKLKLITYYRDRQFKPREPRDRKRKYYLDMKINKSYNPKKELVQVFPINTKFNFLMRIQDYSPDELKILFICMELCPTNKRKIGVKIGGMKNQGFGKIKFKITQIQQGTTADFLLNKEKIINDEIKIKNFILNFCK